MAVRNDANQDSTVGRLNAAGLMPIVVFGVLSIAFGVVLALLLPAFNVLPPQASEEARRTDALFATLLLIGGVVFFLVQGLLYYAAVAFRAKPNDVTDGPSIHGNTLLEIVWTTFPSIIVVVLAVMSFLTWRSNTLVSETPNLINGESIELNAFGQRFAWGFEYLTNEEDINGEPIVLNSAELHVYVGQDVEVDMETRDVIHSFWVPAMRVKQDLLPGRVTTVVFRTIDPETGWEFASAYSPLTVYSEADTNSVPVYDVPTQGDIEAPQRLELINGDDISGEWVEVLAPNGVRGFVQTENITGRSNRYRLVCAELCGGGHGNMYSWLVLHESEEAMLNSWYDENVAARIEPPANPVAFGEQVLDSGQYPCANCHVLDSLGWSGNLGPTLTGIADRAALRAEQTDAENGAEYLVQSIRRPNHYVVPGFQPNIMPTFGGSVEPPPNVSGSYQYMPQEDLNGIVAYLCTETESGSIEDSTCGIDWTFEDGTLVDVDETVEDLTAITDEYQE